MKTYYIYITSLFLLFSVLANGQTTTQNYVKKTGYKSPVTSDNLSTVPTSDKVESIQYFDGIGRPTQSVSVKAATTEADIVTHVEYNQNSQVTKAYMPFSDTESDYLFRPNALNQTNTFYNTVKYENTTNPYSETVYEKSGLNRVRYTAAPGSDWKYDPTDIAYVNPVTETVYINEYANFYYQWPDAQDLIIAPVNFPPSGTDCTELSVPNNDGIIVEDYDIIYTCLNQGILTFRFKLDAKARFIKLKTGINYPLDYNFPDMTLGFLSDGHEVITNYKVEIINNNLVITNANGEECIDGVNTILSLDLREAQVNVLSFDSATQNGNLIRFEYGTNAVNEVKDFSVSFTGNNSEMPTLQYNGFYSIKELSKTITKDENWQLSKGKLHTTEEFKDKNGRVVLKRTYVEEGSTTVALDTQYIYDQFGNLTYVLSPEGSENILDGSAIKQDVLNQLCYQYTYDEHNRLIEKKIPGKDREYIVYNTLHQPVLTQDALLKADNKWLFTKYDAYGRVTYTGQYANSSDRAGLQDVFDGQVVNYETKLASASTINGTTIYYSNSCLPNSVGKMDILTINYYDDYNFDTTLALEASTVLVNETGVNVSTAGVITKTVGVSWSNASFDTQATIENDGGISYKVLHTDKRVMVGLTDVSSNSNHHYNTINYAIHSGYDTLNRVTIYESGTGKYLSPVNFYEAGDTFSVERNGNQILYKKNGEVFYVSQTTSTATLVGDSSFVDTGVAISNVMVYYMAADTAITTNTKGLATGSKVRTLETTKWTTTVSHYDEKARPIYVISENEYLQTNDAVLSWYDFTGNVTQSKTTHKRSNQNPIVTQDKFAYDYQKRLVNQKQSINGSPYTTIFENTYDELGQLVIKKTGVQSNTTSQELVNLVNVAQEDNFLTKGNNIAWNGNIESSQRISGDGYVEYTVTEHEKLNMIGLSDPTGTLDDGYTKIDYAIYTGYGTEKRVYIYEEGVYKSFSPAVYFEVGDVFRVERDGMTIRYKKNNVQFAQTAVTTTPDLIADGCLAALGSYIKDLKVVDINANAGEALQVVNYKNNVRGWLKEINDVSKLGDDLFAFKLNYNTADNATTEKLYNGNISETHWKTASDDVQRSYVYAYDALNRINKANFINTSNTVNNGRYDLNSISYDKNGNILNLARNGYDLTSGNTAVIDNLSYTYAPNTNQLQEVADASLHTEGFKDGVTSGTDYTYDANGNMISDANKGITSITYNHLNLPKKVSFDTGGYIMYGYDATGVKISKMVYDPNAITWTSTYYAGNYVYKELVTQTQSTPAVLEFFNHPEGYIEPPMTSSNSKSKAPLNLNFNYFYQYKDHLGNVRITYNDGDRDGHVDVLRNNGNVDVDADGDMRHEIIQEKNYYAFGLSHKGYNNVITGRDHKYGFGGKEYQGELDLNWYDVSARNYDAALGRWMNLDPLAEDMRRHSPYNYAFDNPVYFQDYDGMAPTGPGDPPDGEEDTDSQYIPDSIKRSQNFTPSARTSSLLSQGAELINDAYSYKAEIKKRIGVGGGIKLFGADLEGEVNLLKVRGKVTSTNDGSNAIKANVNVKLFEAQGSVKIGSEDKESSVKLEVNGYISDINMSADTNGKIDGSIENGKFDKTFKFGQGDFVELTPDDLSTVGVTAKVGPAKVKASVNFKKLYIGLGKIIEGGLNYANEYVDNLLGN